MTAGRTEFELKFTGAPGDVAALQRGDFIASVAPNGGAWERLSSTYYDTPDERLASSGISLRLREEGGRLVQAVKTRGQSSIARIEYEIEIPNQRRFPAATGDDAIDGEIAALQPVLEPIAGTHVDRWAVEVVFRDTRFELAIDIGRSVCRDAEGGDFAAPLAEVELELIDGDPARLFDFSRLLSKQAPLRFSARSKLEAARRLASPPTLIPPAPRTQIRLQMSAADALQNSLNDIAARIGDMQGFLLDYRMPAGVHQMRVALRRLRSIERVFRPFMKGDELLSLARRAKYFAGALGPARDWDVFIGQTLPLTSAAETDLAGVSMLKSRAETIRAEAWADAVAVISSTKFSEFVLDLVEAGALARWRSATRKQMRLAVEEFAPAALDKALKKAVKVAAETPVDAGLSVRHPLRIALKKLRYPVQLFRPVYAKAPRKEYMSKMSMLQDAFGAVNDAVVAQRLADLASTGQGAEAIRAAGFVAGYRAAEAQGAAEVIDEAWRTFEKMTPFWRL
ncbi:CHAD domain-containing protein [Hyphococcus flavus]|uniref:CHAD domain-containing protein n=1 Tax=Hyphococcus flavus TaxID=1866326 RepID=A0AAF0CC78_9PROT|nr:CHAD domain-containing protein [Hyphococcus flavus]WDI32815.1 CHAD domain-containing protein [Hyphococcus flavus]